MRFGGTGSLYSSSSQVDDVLQVHVAGRFAVVVDEHVAAEAVLGDGALDVGGRARPRAA